MSILRDLINEAMDVKLKRQEAQQREVDQDDEENSEEDEMDSGTMVRAAGDEMGTVRVASTMSDGANTMIEHDDTLPSQLGTMVINAEDEEEEGTMKSKALLKYTSQTDRTHSRENRFTWSTLARS